jgi:hypothetical protein
MPIPVNILAAAARAPYGQIKDLAEQHGINYNSLRRAVSEFERSGVRDIPELSASLSQAAIACPPAIELVQPPAPLNLQRWLYCSDIHAPLHSELWIERLVRVARELDVPDLVIGGDAFDFAELSGHGDDIEMPDINQALEIAGQVLWYIKAAFQRVHILPGNHCRRLARRLNKNLAFRNLVKMAVGDLTGIETTENDYLLIDTPYSDIGWAVGHPRFFAAYPTKGLDAVALQRQRHVIGAHSHTLGMSKIGRYWCVSPGMMMRPELTPYLVRSDGLSKHADQSHGFVFVESTREDGDVVTLFANGLTRWSDYA